ncbi:hypothetical protein EDD85DRAFT_956141 [Armillaria nabsnona]|nr:hypothetical protein EDD85DRAFT_956141 [Armillaria nabsnona]
MSAPQTATSVAPKEALKLRLDFNLEVEIAIQANVNGNITRDTTLSLLTEEKLPSVPIITLTTFFLSFVSPFIMLY